jgi:BirA family biotin operon repressor/biotin-[acetyl-CoA-carboxylase] ligase
MYPNFIGQHRLELASVGSTNTYLLDLVSKTLPTEGMLVRTRHQTHGRGQIGSHWHDEPGKSLLFSVLLRPQWLPVDQAYLLTQVTCLAVYDTLHPYEKSIRIKWPNDVYLRDRKIGGMLLQSVIAGQQFRYVVAGLGLNVHRCVWPASLTEAASLEELTGQAWDQDALLEDLLRQLEVRYVQLRQGQWTQVADDYHQALYRRDEPSFFRERSGREFHGFLRGVNRRGHLQVEEDGVPGLRTFDLKEIAFACMHSY